MATISGQLTGTSTSATVNPSNFASEFSIGPINGKGRVTLQYKPPTFTKWRNIVSNGGQPLDTPNLAYEYRFEAVGLDNPVDIYFG